MGPREVNTIGIEILREWARQVGHDVREVRTARVAIDGDESKLAVVATAYQGLGFRVVRPDHDTGVHIQVRVGRERGGAWPTTEIVILDADYAWKLPKICGMELAATDTEYNFKTYPPKLESILAPCTARDPFDLADRLAACR